MVSDTLSKVLKFEPFQYRGAFFNIILIFLRVWKVLNLSDGSQRSLHVILGASTAIIIKNGISCQTSVVNTCIVDKV